MRFKFWKKPDSPVDSQLHEKLDPEIEYVPELDHDIVLGLLQDSDRILDESFIKEKYGLSPLHLRAYMEFLVEKDLLRIRVRRSGKIDRVELTEKGMQYIRNSEIRERVQGQRRS